MICVGTTGLRELNPRYSRDDKGAWTTFRRWRGTRAECDVQASLAGGLNADLAQEDAYFWLLEVSYAGRVTDETPSPSPDDQTVTLWSLQVSRLQKSLWDLPEVSAALEAAFPTLQGRARFRGDLVALARGEVVKYEVDANGETTTAEITEADLEAAAGAYWATLSQVAAEITRGVEHYTLDAFVLRKRSIAVAGASLRPAYTNTNRAFSTATLLATEAISATVADNLPAGYWLKAAPALDQTDSNRFELVQEWTHADSYSTLLYGSPL